VARRLVLITAAVAVALIAIAAGAAYWFFARDGFRQALEVQGTKWIGHPVRIGAARAQFLPRLAIQLTDIRVGDPAALTLGGVELAADLRPLLNGRIENADVLVSDSLIDMPLPFSLPTGPQADGTSEADGPDAAVRVVSIRSIALRSIRLRSRGREIEVSADSSLADNVLTLRRFDAKSGGTALSAEGSVALSPRVDARLKATANRLDVDELVALATAFSSASSGARGQAASQQPPRIAASVSANEASAGALQVRRFAAELTSDGSSVALNRIRFELFGGRYEGSLSARLGTQLSATIASKIEDLDVAQLADFGGVPGTVTGLMSGGATFSGRGADIGQLLRDVSGKGTAAIVDGSIRGLQLVRTVILFFGRPAPNAEAGTDRFDRLDVGFSLANQVVRAHELSLRSADADMAGTGTLNLETDALDGRVDITLSEALSAQAGTDLARYTREGNRVVLPAAIGGTLSKPRLTVDAAAAAKRGLRNEIGRRLKDLFGGSGKR